MRLLPGIIITGLIISLLWIMFSGLFYDPLVSSGMLSLPPQAQPLLIGVIIGMVVGLIGMLIAYQMVRAILAPLLGALLGWGISYVGLSLLAPRVMPFTFTSFAALAGLATSMIPGLMVGKLVYKASLGPPPLPPPRAAPQVRTRPVERHPQIIVREEDRIRRPARHPAVQPQPASQRAMTGDVPKSPPERRVEVDMGFIPPAGAYMEEIPIQGEERVDTFRLEPEKLSPQERRVVEFLSTSDTKQIIPVPDRTSVEGGRYPEIEELLRTSAFNVITILQSLASKSIIKASNLEFKTIICPSCGSSVSLMDFVCRNCRSPNIARQRILQHLVCGYLGPESMFLRDNELVCPRCGEVVSHSTELDESVLHAPGQMGVRVYSTFYRCFDCGEINPEPLSSLKCLTCGKQYDSRNFKARHFYRYLVNEPVLSRLMAGHLPLRELSKRLLELGYEVKMPASLTGSSSVSHRLDMLVSKDGRNLVGVIVVSTPENATVSEIMRVAIIKLDTGLPRLVVLTTSPLSEDALRLAEFQGLDVVDLNNVRDVVGEVVEPLIRSVIREMGGLSH